MRRQLEPPHQMKPNPCKRCGKEPFIYGTAFTQIHCPCDTLTLSQSKRRLDAILGWNAMNPERQSGCPVESQEHVCTPTQTPDDDGIFRCSVCRKSCYEMAQQVGDKWINPHTGEPTKFAHEPAPVVESCGNCRYCQGGICRRFPPAIEGEGSVDHQPSVAIAGWCGEWRAK